MTDKPTLPNEDAVREAVERLRKALTTKRQLCRQCDGCGWYEGGESIQTQCEVCLGDGHEDAPDVFAALSLLHGVRLVAVEPGQHVYTSRFKPGDEVWTITTWWGTKAGSGWRVMDVPVDWEYDLIGSDDDLRPTRAEAEAEAKRRNEAK